MPGQRQGTRESLKLDAEIGSPFLDTTTVAASHPAMLNDPHSTRVNPARSIDVTLTLERSAEGGLNVGPPWPWSNVASIDEHLTICVDILVIRIWYCASERRSLSISTLLVMPPASSPARNVTAAQPVRPSSRSQPTWVGLLVDIFLSRFRFQGESQAHRHRLQLR
jgi:hypothetical protein